MRFTSVFLFLFDNLCSRDVRIHRKYSKIVCSISKTLKKRNYADPLHVLYQKEEGERTV